MAKADHPYRPAWPDSEIHVCPAGKEKWSGRFAEPNGHDSDGPLPSLDWALSKLADSPPAEPVTLWLDGGMYFLDRTLELTEETPLVTIAARPGQDVTLSGGRRIENFHETTRNGLRAWVAQLPEVAAGQWYFRSLYVDNQPARRTRVPAEGTWRIASVPGMTFDAFIGPKAAHHKAFYLQPDQLGDWSNVEDIDAVAVHYWLEERMALAAIDPASGRIDTQVKPWFPLKDDAAARCARIWFENVPEALERPGQWYLDRASGELTYLPTDEQDLETTVVIAPVLGQLIRIAGQPGRPARGIFLQDLRLAHCDWTPIPGRGTDSQAAYSVPGLVEMKHVRQCGLLRCRFGPAGPYGLELGFGARGNRVEGCRFERLGAGGIKLIGPPAGSDPADRVSHNIVSGCEIHHCTDVFPSAVGILVIHADNNIVRGNHIHHLEYSGISCGWTWGFGDSATFNNRIADNHIHHLGTGLLNDMGGIYTLGQQPGTVICGNHIHHITAENYGGWAIYADEGSSYVVIENNLLHHTSSECFNLHYGKETILRNNVLAYSGLGVISISAAGDWNSLTIQRNIVLSDGKPVLVARDEDSLAQRGFASDLNCFWDTAGEVTGGDEMRDEMSQVTWKRYTLAQLQQMGYDIHSLAADPVFADPANGDFHLPADSPAFATGFAAFTAAGVRVGYPNQ